MRHTKTITDIGDIMDAVGKESYEELRDALDSVCSEIACRFGLYDKSGRPRNAAILDIVASSPCLSCVSRRLSGTANTARVDGIYTEVHKLAVNVLIEELYNEFSNMGYSVSILSEAETKYGKVDVLIKPTNFGIALQYGTNELMIEIKTGVSVSIPQIFRYLLDKESDTIILWRIRKRQVLSFNGELLTPLLKRYMKTCILRGQRLLATPEQTSCKHSSPTDWSPTQGELQEMLEDFAVTIVETLPLVVKTVFEKLGVKRIDSER
jgi:hypothetical protein